MALTLSDMAQSMMGKKVGERLREHCGSWSCHPCWRCRWGRLIRRPYRVMRPIYAGGALREGILKELMAATETLERIAFVPQPWLHRETLPEVD
jgi:NADH:ubiquinone oxidoreductase subunit F (NADH-binding)